MKHYNVSYFLGQGVKSLWRNGVMSLASVAVLMSCLVLMGGFSLLVANLNTNLDRLKLLNEIVVFTEFDASDDEIAAIEAHIRSLDNVSEVRHVTKAEALEQLKSQSSEAEHLYDEITPENNPLSDSFEISYEDDARVATLQFELEQMEGLRKVANRSDIAGTIARLRNAVMLVFIWFLVILFAVSIFVIINTIRIAVFARREEISVMRYVGATGWFITMPFLFEGAIIGLVAGVAAYFVEKYVYHYVETMFSSDVQILTILPFDSAKVFLLFGFILVGILTGVAGSLISLQKHVHD